MVAQRFFTGNFRSLHRAADFDFAFLLKSRKFIVAADFKGALVGFEIFGLDLDAGVLLNVVTRLFAQFDLLGQFGQTFGVKRIIGVEMFNAGLVQAGQRDRFKLKPVHGQIAG